jgi:hypothetical protein
METANRRPKEVRLSLAVGSAAVICASSYG